MLLANQRRERREPPPDVNYELADDAVAGHAGAAARRTWQARAVRRFIDAGDATLDCEVVGEGPLVVCAHGFPDCSRTFRSQVGPLVDAGYRVALPTMRGYAPSSRARGGLYDAAALGRDLVAVADALSPGAPVRLVGHDWGAIAAYAATALAPARFHHLVTMAVPHLRVAGPRWLRPRQLARSWYIGLFQLRGEAERRLVADDLALVDRLWRAWSPGYAAPAEELARVKDALRSRAEAVLAPYRALASPAAAPRAAPLLVAPTEIPATYLHGADDGCVGAELVPGVERAYRRGVEVHLVPGAGHFLHLEAPDRVNEILLARLAS